MDTEKLIISIQVRECLWNQRSKHYHSRDVQRRNWKEVSEELQSKVDDIKKKWRGLRDIFRREYKRATTHRAGDSGEEYIPKWPYYNMLLFLKDTCTSQDSIDNVLSIAVDEGDESDFEHMHQTTENASDTTLQTSSLNTQQSSVYKSPVKKVLKRPRELSDFVNKNVKVEEENLNLVKGNMEDSEMQFLRSLHPFLKQIPFTRQLAVRANMMQALMSEVIPQYSPTTSN